MQTNMSTQSNVAITCKTTKRSVAVGWGDIQTLKGISWVCNCQSTVVIGCKLCKIRQIRICCIASPRLKHTSIGRTPQCSIRNCRAITEIVRPQLQIVKKLGTVVVVGTCCPVVGQAMIVVCTIFTPKSGSGWELSGCRSLGSS